MMTATAHDTSLPRRAKAAIAMLAALLITPAIGGFFIDHGERSEREKRQLTNWETVNAAWGSKAWFSTLDDFIDDHLAFVTPLNSLYQKTLFYVFRDAAIDRITVGKDGFVFLNAHDMAAPHGALRRTCDGSPRFLGRLYSYVDTIHGWLDARGIPATFAFVPTKPILYADALPASVPADVRERCQQVAENPHLILTSRLREKASAVGPDVYYPIEAMMFSRNVEAFYPPGNFHANSMLNHVFALGLLRRMGIHPDRSEFFEGGKLSEITADLPTLGFKRKVSAWVFPYTRYGVEALNQRPSWVRDIYPTARDFRTFSTSKPLSQRRALLFSNSFGGFIAPHLAPGFASILHVSLNHVRDEDRLEVFTRLVERYDPTDVIFILHDGGQPFRGLGKLARELAPIAQAGELTTGD